MAQCAHKSKGRAWPVTLVSQAPGSLKKRREVCSFPALEYVWNVFVSMAPNAVTML